MFAESQPKHAEITLDWYGSWAIRVRGADLISQPVLMSSATRVDEVNDAQ